MNVCNLLLLQTVCLQHFFFLFVFSPLVVISNCNSSISYVCWDRKKREEVDIVIHHSI